MVNNSYWNGKGQISLRVVGYFYNAFFLIVTIGLLIKNIMRYLLPVLISLFQLVLFVELNIYTVL